MDTIKINYSHFWEGFDPKNNFFTNLLREKYIVEISNNPQIMFYSVFQTGNTTNLTNWQSPLRKPIQKTSIFFEDTFPSLHNSLKKRLYNRPKFKMNKIEGDYIKVFYASENVIPDMNNCDFAFSFEYDEEMQNKHHLRLPYYVFESKNFGQELIKTSNMIKQIKNENKHFCNFIYRAKSFVREDFFRKLSKYKKIDAPGVRLNNRGGINAKTANESRSKLNWGDDKIEFLKDYKFTIAFENESRAGYTTEKIYQPMLSASMPIYYGNPLIRRDFNTKSFLNYHDYKNMKDFLETVKQIDTDKKLFNQYAEEPWFYNNKPSKYFNKERILKQLDKIVESSL